MISEQLKIPYTPAAGGSGVKSRHWRIVEGVRARKRLSMDELNDRRLKWDELDERVLAYMPETEVDDYLSSLRKDDGKPQYTTISIPWSYAVLLTAHTYLSTTYLGRDPILQFMGRHGESQSQVLGLEAIMNYQLRVGCMLPHFYLWLYDAYKYGIGIIGHYWDETTETVSRIVEERETLFGFEVGPKRKKKVTDQIAGYQGNRAFTVRPHDWLPDPRVPLWNFQEGEFCGRIVPIGWNTLKQGEEDGRYFNIKELREKVDRVRGRIDQEPGRQEAEVPEHDRELQMQADLPDDPGYVECVEMCIELIPDEWGLGSSRRPEKWMFTVGADEVVIAAAPLGEYHNKFPFEAMITEFNGHSFVSTSPLEQVTPLEDVLTWLFNSHFYNVRKVLNDQMFVDPSRVEMADLLDPLPGGLIRMKPSAYGTNPADAVAQMRVVDVTNQHMQDAGNVMELIQRLNGINDELMGHMQGGRKTATEVRTATGFGMSRLKTIAEFGSAHAFGPFSQMLVQSTQQHLSIERAYRIVGNVMPIEAPEGYLNVGPSTITGSYDFVPVDGSMPVDRYAQAALWKDLLANMAQVPQVMANYDVGQIFAWVARLAGLKNVDQFRIKVRPDEMLSQQAQAGNIVPVGGEGIGGEPGRPEIASGAAGAGSVPASVSRPAQIAGMGNLL